MRFGFDLTTDCEVNYQKKSIG